MKKERDSGIELLRIIAMFMVIGVHLWLYGKYFDVAGEVGGIVYYSAFILKTFFRSAVNIFILITGFFTVRSKFDLKKSYGKVAKTYLAIFFYSVALSILTLCLGGDYQVVGGTYVPTSQIVVRMFLPLTSQYWYFLTDYILLLLVVPFVNIALNGITKKQYQVLLAVTSFIMSVWLLLANINPTGNFMREYGYEGIYAGKNLFSFIYIYIIGGYIGLHCNNHKRPKVIYLLLCLVCLGINCGLYAYLPMSFEYTKAAMQYANPFVILVAVFLFMFFKDLHFKSKFINILGSTTIGIYAISEFKFVREWLWNIFDFNKFDCTNIFKNAIMILGSMIIIFLVCSIIELLRQLLFNGVEKGISKLRKTE